MAAMSTLRSLCMVRVHQLYFPASLLTVKYLPDTLARDIAEARLFQGNYMLKRRTRRVSSGLVITTFCCYNDF